MHLGMLNTDDIEEGHVESDAGAAEDEPAPLHAHQHRD